MVIQCPTAFYTETAQSSCKGCLAFISHSYESSSTLMLSLFGISQVDAVSVLGTLNKDKAAVPDDWKAAAAQESPGTGGEGTSDRRGGSHMR